jgi:hypothetical protein
MNSVRYWSVRNARFLEWFYQRFESALISLHPVFKFICYDRLERPMATLEKWIKGFMFDCQMCGQCVLSSTGMSCPMNCPKTLRNGPCGGVRPDGNCEVKPDMRCVWIEGIEGSSRMRNGRSIRVIQIAVDHSLQGRSSWLRVVKQHFGIKE